MTDSGAILTVCKAHQPTRLLGIEKKMAKYPPHIEEISKEKKAILDAIYEWG